MLNTESSMQYRIDPKSGNKITILGFGCMRFPKNIAQTDIKKTEQLIEKAVQTDNIDYYLIHIGRQH